jgi:CubicO group peptidase (beta-lactamase class C family)
MPPICRTVRALIVAAAAAAAAVILHFPAVAAATGSALPATLTPAQASAWFDGYIAPYEAASNFDAFAFVYFTTFPGGGSPPVLTARTRGRCYTVDGRDAGPPDATTSLFRIGSVGKVLTAVAVFQLAERGLVNLDAQLAQYIPSLPAEIVAANVTVRDTLRHTVGVEDRVLNIYLRGRGIDETIGQGLTRMWTRQNAAARRGLSYSNYGVTLAGGLVEAVTGQRLLAYVRQNITGPLGIAPATVAFHLDLAGNYTGVCYPRASVGAEPYQVRTTPSGDYYMTANGIATLMAAIASGTSALFQSPSTAATLYARVYPVGVGIDAMAHIFTRSSYGGRVIASKDGGVFHFSSNAALYPETGDGYIALSTRGLVPSRVFIEREIQHRLLTDNNLTVSAQPSYPFAVAAPCDSARLERASGAYRSSRCSASSPLSVICIFGAGDGLYVSGSDGCSVYARGQLYIQAAGVPGLGAHQLLLQAWTNTTIDRANQFILITFADATATAPVVLVENFSDLATMERGTWTDSSASVYTLLAFFVVALLTSMFALPVLVWRAYCYHTPGVRSVRGVTPWHWASLFVTMVAWFLFAFVAALAGAPYPALYLDVHPSWVAVQVLVLMLVIPIWAIALVVVVYAAVSAYTGRGNAILHSPLSAGTPSGKSAQDLLPNASSATNDHDGDSSLCLGRVRVWLAATMDGQHALAIAWAILTLSSIIGFPGVYAVNLVTFTVW